MNYFAHENFREKQEKLHNDVLNSVSNGQIIFTHAPTGIGKTAAVLASTLPVAIKENKVIFFLTNRHSQHEIVFDTVKKIEKKVGRNLQVLDLIGRKHMCAFSALKELNSSDFNETCFQLRKNNRCDYYSKIFNRDGELTEDGVLIIDEFKKSTKNVKESISFLSEKGACPYFTSLEAGKSAKIVIADYYHFFNKNVRQSVLTKISKRMDDIILVVDEAHNLPDRLRELQSARTTTRLVSSAVKECEEIDRDFFEKFKEFGKDLEESLINFNSGETIVQKTFLNNLISKHFSNFEELIEKLKEIVEKVYETEERSFCNSFSEFLKKWETKSDDGIVRIIKVEEFNGNFFKSINLHGLDPSKVCDIVKSVHSCVFMSGTLKPLNMYGDLLGVGTIFEEYGSPFLEKNRKVIIFPKTTTQFKKRNERTFVEMGEELLDLLEDFNRNTIIFFPSYFIRDKVLGLINYELKQTIFKDERNHSKIEKEELLNNFKSYKNKGGAVLFSVIGGNFSEGVDFPGDELEMVVIVGVPLSPPDLLTKSLINYYDGKFGRGWFYAYTFPAIRKVFQAMGRLIRSGTDKGVIVLMDERYSWSDYRNSLPKNAIISLKPKNDLKQFYS